MSSNINDNIDTSLPAETSGTYVGLVLKTTFIAVLNALKAGLTTAKGEVTALQAGKLDASQLGVANGAASLGSDGKLPSAQLPALAITSTSVVATQAAQLALVAQEGDVAVRSDLNKSYIKNSGTAGTMADWTELLTPTDLVLSVMGKTGAITAADLGLDKVVTSIKDDFGAVKRVSSDGINFTDINQYTFERPPNLYDNLSKGYSLNSIFQFKKKIWKPKGTMSNSFASWVQQNPLDVSGATNFADVVGSANTIFTGGSCQMKAGFTGPCLTIRTTISGSPVDTIINILPNGELDNETVFAQMSKADTTTDVQVIQVYDQSGNNNHAVLDATILPPILEWDYHLQRFIIINKGTNNAGMLRLPHGLVNSAGSALTSGFGVIGNNYTVVALMKTVATLAGPIAFCAIGDYSSSDNNVGAWSAGTIYTKDQVVSNGFKSLTNGNIGNALPTAGADNTNWAYYPNNFTNLQLNSYGQGAWEFWDNGALGSSDTHSQTTGGGQVANIISPCQLSILGGISSSTGTLVFCNEDTATSTTAHSASAYGNGFLFGERKGVNSLGHYVGVTIANTAISTTQLQKIKQGAYVKFNIKPQVLDQVFTIGDSRTNGTYPFSGKQTSYAIELAKVLDGKAKVYNLGVGSQTTASILTVSGRGQVDYAILRYNPKVNNVAVVLAGVNDFLVSGLTASQCVQGIQAITAPLKAAGFKVVLINELATSNVSGSASTNLPLVRAQIAALGTAGMSCDYILDPLQFTELSNASDGIYYPDGLHQSNAFWEPISLILAKLIQNRFLNN